MECVQVKTLSFLLIDKERGDDAAQPSSIKGEVSSWLQMLYKSNPMLGQSVVTVDFAGVQTMCNRGYTSQERGCRYISVRIRDALYSDDDPKRILASLREAVETGVFAGVATVCWE